MDFCNPFDAAIAAHGPAAVFLLDREGKLRLAPRWSRDTWGRHGADRGRDEAWLLLRDPGTTYVILAYATGAWLLDDHPRLEVRRFPDEAAARAAWAALGRPPVDPEAWS